MQVLSQGEEGISVRSKFTRLWCNRSCEVLHLLRGVDEAVVIETSPEAASGKL